MITKSLVGKNVTNYKIMEKLGKGGMGVVYKALDIDLDVFVTLKLMTPMFGEDEIFLRRFKEEARGLAKAKHPNIVTVHRILSFDSMMFIVMEYIDGQTLEDYYKDSWPVHWRESLPFMIDISQAFECAHNNFVFHRDIKPSNIMISQQGVLKVVDFGLAKIDDPDSDITKTLLKQGTLKYMSPERVKLQPDINYEKSDIYSLGMTFYEMLAGRSPFDDDTASTIQDAILQKRFVSPNKFNPKIPKRLTKIIMKAIEKEPENRYQSVKEMLSEIKDFDKTVQKRSNIGKKKFYSVLVAVLLLFAIVFVYWRDNVLGLNFDISSIFGIPITISTNPPDAEIFINNEPVGQSPVNEYPVDKGAFSLIIEKSNFFLVDTNLVAGNDLPTMFSFSLEPAAYLSIDVNPAESEVFLDGRGIDANELLTLELPIGQHEIEISSEGHITKKTQFSIEQGDNPNLIYTLDRVTSIKISSVPSNVSVWLNNKLVGKTPLTKSELEPGRYKMRLKLDDSYSVHRRTITIAKGQTMDIDVVLIEFGGLRVETTPPGARIMLDNKLLGVTPKIFRKVRVGKRRLILKKNGFRDYKTSVTITHKTISKVKVNL